MGKTKIAAIDDSKPQEEEKKPRKKVNPNPELEEKRDKSLETRKKVNPNPELLEKEKKAQAEAKVESKESDESKESEVKAETPKEKKVKQPKHGKKERSKKYQEKAAGVDKGKLYPLSEAIEAAKQASYSKFEGSLELHINTNIKNIRGLVSLPFASGKALKVLAFGKGAEESGADQVGDDEALKELEKGKVDADVIVTTPEWMPKLARAAKALGPRGLMPNPKNGTISSDLKKAVSEIQSGKVEYKTQKDSQVIHLAIGKVSQPTEEVVQNIKILMNAIGKTKTQKAVIAPSMGPGVKVDLSSV